MSARIPPSSSITPTYAIGASTRPRPELEVASARQLISALTPPRPAQQGAQHEPITARGGAPPPPPTTPPPPPPPPKRSATRAECPTPRWAVRLMPSTCRAERAPAPDARDTPDRRTCGTRQTHGIRRTRRTRGTRQMRGHAGRAEHAALARCADTPDARTRRMHGHGGCTDAPGARPRRQDGHGV